MGTRGARHVPENWSGMTNVKGDEERAMGKDTEAVQKFLDGNVCSQAVLGHYCERLNLDRSTALKIAAGFGAGMHMGKTCGAVTGAYMVLGLKFGTVASDKPEGREDVYNAVVEFTRAFKERHGTADCRELLGCDISTDEGSETAREQNLFTTVCPRFVKDATELVDAIIDRKT